MCWGGFEVLEGGFEVLVDDAGVEVDVEAEDAVGVANVKVREAEDVGEDNVLELCNCVAHEVPINNLEILDVVTGVDVVI